MFSDLHCDMQTKSPNKDITIICKVKYRLPTSEEVRFGGSFLCGRIFGTVLALHILQLVAMVVYLASSHS